MILGCEIKRIIEQEWKIPLPKTYKNGLNHNNCIPCYKAGKAKCEISNVHADECRQSIGGYDWV